MITVYLGAGLQRFLDGDFFGGLLYMVTSVLGDWTYGIGFAALYVMLFFRSQSVAMPIVVFIIMMPTVLFIIGPDAWAPYGLAVLVGIISIAAKFYLRRG